MSIGKTRGTYLCHVSDCSHVEGSEASLATGCTLHMCTDPHEQEHILTSPNLFDNRGPRAHVLLSGV